MNLSLCKNYLGHIHGSLITNDTIIFIFSIIEYLPLIYHILLSSMNLSNIPIPEFYKNKISYISYYDLFHDYFSEYTYPIYLYIVIPILLISFIIYKNVIVNFHFFNNNSKIFGVLVNFYEFLYFRLFMIFILDIEINKIIYDSAFYSIISILLLGGTMLATYYHFEISHLFISMYPMGNSSIDNNIILINEKYLVFIKMLICFSKNNKIQNITDPLLKFINFGVFILFLVLTFHQSVLVLFHPFSYLTKKWSVMLKFFLNILISLLELYIIIIRNYEAFSFVIFILSSLPFSIVLSYFFLKISLYKMLDPKHPIGNLIFLIKEAQSKKIKTFSYYIIHNHKCNCSNLKCLFCQKIKLMNLKDNELPFEYLCELMFKHLIKKKDHKEEQSLNNEKDITEYLSFYHILELYICFLSQKKNLIKIILKYNEIKSLYKLASKGGRIGHYLYSFFSMTFTLNLEILYFQITKNLVNDDGNKISYLISIDNMAEQIKIFIKRIFTFFKLNMKTPHELIKLAQNFDLLKKKIDFDFLVKKENKYNYQCGLTAYIMEEIFNEKLNPNVSVLEYVHSLDEILEQRFKNDKILLILYDIVNGRLQIKQSSKDLIMYKNKTLDQVFPPYLAGEGNKRIITILSQNSNNSFEFYCKGFGKKKTIEFFFMKFMGIPSLDYNNQFIYIICNFRIIKGSLLIFENMFFNMKTNKVLVGISEIASSTLNIPIETLEKYKETKKYILFQDICNEKTNLVDLEKLKQILNPKNFKEKKAEQAGSIKKGQSITPTPAKETTNDNTNNAKANNKSLNLNLVETIGHYDIYSLSDGLKTNHHSYMGNTTNTHEPVNSKGEITSYNESNIEIIFNPTNTGMSSSTFTRTSSSTYNHATKNIKNEHDFKYRQFYKYTYYIISFNILILIIISIFLAIELVNNASIERTFKIITNFCDFQSYFFYISLSIFSLTCNSDYLSQLDCLNQFVIYSKDFAKSHNLSENELLNEYISRESMAMTELIISTLKTWEQDQYEINSDDLTSILNEVFVFTALEEVAEIINPVQTNLTFEDAIKRFVNTINLLTSLEEFSTSPVFTITTDGKNLIDMDNVKKEKEPINGVYLNEAQKYYYTLILNYQKYIQRLLSLNEVLFDYFDSIISSTSTEILIFIIGFICLHVIMMIMSFAFTLKYKNIHMDYFTLIYSKISDKDFVLYYKKKLEELLLLLDFYKESPILVLNRLEKLKKKELNRKLKQSKEQSKLFLSTTPSSQTKAASKSSATTAIEIIKAQKTKELIDTKVLNSIYWRIAIGILFIKIIILFSLYLVLMTVLYIIILSQINSLRTMKRYSRLTYSNINNLYINMGLTQIMSLTNQTEEMLFSFMVTEQTATNYKTNYLLHERIQELFDGIMEITKMEESSQLFVELPSLIDIKCDTFYEDLGDAIIDKVNLTYINSDYFKMFSEYCSTAISLNTYKNDKLQMIISTYKTLELLEMFTGRTYEIYAKVNNSDLLYTIYMQIFFLIRPVGTFMNNYLFTVVISNIITHYNLVMILFLVFNFLYETLILFVLKIKIIDQIIHSTKEIITVAKAMECFE